MAKIIILFVILFLAPLNLSWTADYYCSNSSKGSNDGSSWTNAFDCQANFFASVLSGDTIYIDGGTAGVGLTYTVGEDTSIHVTKSGLTFRIGQDSGHNGVATFDLQGTYDRLFYMLGIGTTTIDGGYGGGRNIKIQNNKSSYDGVINGGTTGDSHPTGIVIKNLEITNVSMGIVFSWSSDPGGTLIEIDNVYIHNIWGTSAIKLTWDMANNYLLDRTVARYDAVIIHHSTIQANHSASAEGDGADLIQGMSGLSVYNCTLYGSTEGTAGTDHQDAIQLINSKYHKFYNNYVYNIGNGFVSYDRLSTPIMGSNEDGYLRIYNNVFEWVSTPVTTTAQWLQFGFTSATGHTVKDVLVANNTFIECPNNALGTGVSTNLTIESWIVENNILINCTIGNVGHSSGGSTVGMTVDYNVMAAPQRGDITFTVGGSAYEQTHKYTTVPTFTSYTRYTVGNNFIPASGDTIAKDHGVSLSTYFSGDKNGTTRPFGSAWDIGAYEYTPGGAISIGAGVTLSGVTIQ